MVGWGLGSFCSASGMDTSPVPSVSEGPGPSVTHEGMREAGPCIRSGSATVCPEGSSVQPTSLLQPCGGDLTLQERALRS